ncbi:MAG: DNA-directed RNA polymerase subunit K [Nanoarchaeota archaeon]|nr:DNA-directed RNA polymerase subunit K [Nanoarchaeota archaeon]
MVEIQSARLTKYEKARLIGSRALQIAMGAPFLVKISKKKLEEIKYNPVEIAKLELIEDVMPMTVVRPLPKAPAEEQKKP